MAIVTRDDFITRLRTRLGDELTDEDISLVEDFSDTYDSVYNPDNEDWKSKYEENDRKWRERYMERFNGGGDSGILDIEKANAENVVSEAPEEMVSDSPKTYEELFS